ncbi:MAG: choice-of-anchor D domain-containing protein [Solirubrobacterales bacterium]|nr:choice-of-anchor D domain-containing protein [Solirubrobacterales bacterium]
MEIAVAQPSPSASAVTFSHAAQLRGRRGRRLAVDRWVRAGVVLAVVGMFLASAASAPAAPHIYWTNFRGGIGEANLDGSAAHPAFITGTDGPAGIVVDGQHIYWENFGFGAIARAKLDGSGVQQLFLPGLDALWGIAVDRQHLYWTGRVFGPLNFNAVAQANLDGSAVMPSFIRAVNPYGVAVDGQHIYWADRTTGAIGRADLDGSGVDPSFITGAKNPQGVAVNGQHIYWSNSGIGAIGEANLDGSGVQQRFITGAKNPFGMAVDAEHIYWANEASSTIGRANLDGTEVNQRFITAAKFPWGVAVSVPVVGVSPASPPPFPTTAVNTLSAPLTLTVTNSGQQDLSVSGLSFTGADPDDFIVGSNTCLGAVLPGQSCQLKVDFVPRAQGSRTGALQIASSDYANNPLRVSLSGTGGSARRESRPGAGKVELLRCAIKAKTIIERSHGKRRKRTLTHHVCRGRVVSAAPIRVSKRSAAETAVISRRALVYATGISVNEGLGHQQLIVTVRHALHRGSYTLSVKNRSSRHRVKRTTITIY